MSPRYTAALLSHESNRFGFEGDKRPASVGLRNLPQLSDARLRVSVLLPAHRHHVVARLARRHDDAELIARRGEVVVGLVAQRDLPRRVSRELTFR